MTKKNYKFRLRLSRDGDGNYFLNVRAIDGGYPVTGMNLDFPVIEKERRPGLDFTRVRDGKTARNYAEELKYRTKQQAVLSHLELEVEFVVFLHSNMNLKLPEASREIKITADDGTKLRYYKKGKEPRNGKIEDSSGFRVRGPRPKRIEWD